jgi:hypothetical protein
MSLDRIVLAVAGAFILSSVLLAVYHSINWLWFTGFCPLALILKRLGIAPGQAFG